MLATKIIIGVTVAAFVLIGVRDGGNFAGTGRSAFNLELYGPFVHQGQWWRVFSVSLVHGGVLHLFFNMLLLWIVGQLLEPGAGPLRFGLLYVVSVAAGSAGALIAQPHTLSAGASGGVFGVAAAATIVMHRQGVRFWDTGFGPLLAINFVLDFFIPNVSIAPRQCCGRVEPGDRSWASPARSSSASRRSSSRSRSRGSSFSRTFRAECDGRSRVVLVPRAQGRGARRRRMPAR